jgi:hypothetical protein
MSTEFKFDRAHALSLGMTEGKDAIHHHDDDGHVYTMNLNWVAVGDTTALDYGDEDSVIVSANWWGSIRVPFEEFLTSNGIPFEEI